MHGIGPARDDEPAALSASPKVRFQDEPEARRVEEREITKVQEKGGRLLGFDGRQSLLRLAHHRHVQLAGHGEDRDVAFLAQGDLEVHGAARMTRTATSSRSAWGRKAGTACSMTSAMPFASKPWADRTTEVRRSIPSMAAGARSSTAPSVN